MQVIKMTHVLGEVVDEGTSDKTRAEHEDGLVRLQVRANLN